MAEALCSTNAKANFQRLTRLLICGGVKLLRETFDSIHSPADLPLRLSDPAIRTQLRGARLTQPQWSALYPSPGVYGKSADFDISLISRLLRTICNLTPPPGPRGWDDLPNSSDHSLEADLVRIKCYRNDIYGHSKILEITDAEFLHLWKEISEALLRIAGKMSTSSKNEWKKSIDQLLHDPLTPEAARYVEELSVWYKKDMDLKNTVELCHEGIQNVSQRLMDLQEDHARTENTLIELRIAFESLAEFCQASRNSNTDQLGERAGSQGMCVVPMPLEEERNRSIWSAIMSVGEQVERFLQYLRNKLSLTIGSYRIGSLLIAVECSSLQILEGLWEDYCSGHLNEVAQKELVTEEVLKKVNLSEIKLKTHIREEDYQSCKKYFLGISAQFDESSCSRGVSQEAESKGDIAPSIPGQQAPSMSTKDKDSDDYSLGEPQARFKVQTELDGKQDLLERISKLESRIEALERVVQIKVDPVEKSNEGSRILQKEDSELKRGLDVFEQGSHDESLEIKKQKLSEQSETEGGKQEGTMAEMKGSASSVGLGEVEF